MNPQGQIETREALAIRLADRKLRRKLEAITNPQLRAECLKAFDSLDRKAGR